MKLLEYNKPLSKFYGTVNEKTFKLLYHACIAADITNKRINKIYSYLYSDGNIIAGTESTMLNISKMEIKKGLYKILICTKRKILLHHETNDVSEYPNFERVIFDEKKIKKINPIVIDICSNSNRMKSYNKIIKNIHTCSGLNIKYLDKVSNDKWYVYHDNPEEPVNFFNNSDINKYTMASIIMPIILRTDI